MSAATQQPLDFSEVSSPISGGTKATIELVGNDWRADEDWAAFIAACREVAVAEEDRTWTSSRGEPVYHYGIRHFVNPNDVRARLTNEHGLMIEPRRYSAFWARAAGKHGFLDADGWVENSDTKGGNAGKPLRRYRLRSNA